MMNRREFLKGLLGTTALVALPIAVATIIETYRAPTYYYTLKGIPLEEFGNRIPNISAEIEIPTELNILREQWRIRNLVIYEPAAA